MDNNKSEEIQNNQKAIENAKIEFPVSFVLKAVMNTTLSDKVNKDNLEEVLKNLKVKSSFIDSKKSSKGTYISYHYNVKLEDKPQLDKLYADLKMVDGLKFAL